MIPASKVLGMKCELAGRYFYGAATRKKSLSRLHDCSGIGDNCVKFLQ